MIQQFWAQAARRILKGDTYRLEAALNLLEDETNLETGLGA